MVKVEFERELERIPLNGGWFFIIRIVKYEGVRKQKLDGRLWYTDSGGELRPSKKGVGLDSALVPPFRRAMDIFEREGD